MSHRFGADTPFGLFCSQQYLKSMNFENIPHFDTYVTLLSFPRLLHRSTLGTFHTGVVQCNLCNQSVTLALVTTGKLI